MLKSENSPTACTIYTERYILVGDCFSLTFPAAEVSPGTNDLRSNDLLVNSNIKFEMTPPVLPITSRESLSRARYFSTSTAYSWQFFDICVSGVCKISRKWGIADTTFAIAGRRVLPERPVVLANVLSNFRLWRMVLQLSGVEKPIPCPWTLMKSASFARRPRVSPMRRQFAWSCARHLSIPSPWLWSSMTSSGGCSACLPVTTKN